MRDLSIRISVDSAQAEAAMGRVDSKLASIGKTAETANTGTTRFQTSLGGLAKATGGFIAVEVATRNLIKFGTESVRSMSAQEAATVKLTTALRAQGTATPDLVMQYERMAEQFQRTTVFSDDLVEEMQALLVQIGNVMPNQMNAALKASADLSAGMGIDLRSATLLVAKAFAGGGDELGRLKAILGDTVGVGSGMTGILDAINQKFGGQAQAQMETYAGKVANLSNRWDDFQERVGALLLRVIDPLLSVFEAMPQWLQTTTFGFATLTVTLAPLAAAGQLLLSAFGSSLLGAFTALGGFLTSTILPLIGTALPIAFRALAALLTPPAGLVVLGILAAYEVWKHWDGIKDIVIRVYNAVKEWLVDKFTAIVGKIKGAVDGVVNAFKDMYDKVVGHSYVPDMIDEINRQFARLPDVMVNRAAWATQSVSGLFQKLGSGLKTIFGSTIGQINDVFQAAFTGGGGIGGAVKSLATTATSAVLGMIPVVGPVLSQFSGAIVAGFSKIGGALKKLFGGPSAKELAGREVVANFEANLHTMLTESQKLEAGNESWKQTVIAVRDAYVQAGLTEAAALADVKALWDASKAGPEAVARAIQTIQDKMHGLTQAARGAAGAIAGIGSFTVPDLPRAESFHRGGTILPFLPRAHRGLAIDEVPIIAQTGEGILNRAAMRNIGGAAGLNRLNAGGSGTPRTTVINHVSIQRPIINSLLDAQAVGRELGDALSDQMLSRKKVGVA